MNGGLCGLSWISVLLISGVMVGGDWSCMGAMLSDAGVDLLEMGSGERTGDEMMR